MGFFYYFLEIFCFDQRSLYFFYSRDIILTFDMEALEKLIENNPGLFRVIGIGLGLFIGYLFFLLFM